MIRIDTCKWKKGADKMAVFVATPRKLLVLLMSRPLQGPTEATTPAFPLSYDPSPANFLPQAPSSRTLARLIVSLSKWGGP